MWIEAVVIGLLACLGVGLATWLAIGKPILHKAKQLAYDIEESRHGQKQLQDALDNLSESVKKVGSEVSEIARASLESGLPFRSSEALQVERSLAKTCFAEFSRQIQEPGARSSASDAVWDGSAKRYFDVLAVGSQALSEATKLGVEFTAKGREALASGGHLMRHTHQALTVVVDSSGKVVEFGRVVGPSALQVSLSVYTVAVGVAWTLVANDLKGALNGVQLTLEELVDIHETAEYAEFEAAYELVRFLSDVPDLDRRLAINQAIWVAKNVRSRCRQRLSLQSEKLTSPSWGERLFTPRKWKRDDKDEVETNIKNLATMQMSILLEAHCLMLLGNGESQLSFSKLMQEEALALREISGRYARCWESVKGRQDIEPPILIAAIDGVANGLALDCISIIEGN